MRTIWKYEIDPQYLNDPKGFEIEMPVVRDLLSFQTQQGTPVLWATVESQAAIEPVRFYLVGTGAEIPTPAILSTYRGSCQLIGGLIVCHLLEPVRVTA